MEQNLTHRVIDVDIESEMKKSFIEYSMSVIISRALPDVRDGLKPVHRRILYAMYEDGLYPERPYKKCATTVGNVLGRYHPHGDASVYDALVRLAQNFSMRHMLVDGHGNFGSVDGDPPAAYRYTEAKMSKISMEMLTDIDKETVDFTPNFDDSMKEPSVLPAKFPNLLVNGSTGIAVGMATNIPPHNLREVCEAVKLLIENPDATLDELMEHIQGPDFPTAGIIMGRSGIRAAYATGRGKVTLRARAEIVERKDNRYSIIVTELPYQVNKATLIEKIAEMVRDKRLEGISNAQDHSSDREGMCITIDIKRDAVPSVVLNNLYKYTQMQITYGVIQLAIVGGEPKVLTLKQMLEHYLSHQLEVIVRRTIFLLAKASDRAHILEALIVAVDNIDEVIAILRSSKNIPEGKQRLSERFGFDEVQVTAIVMMRFGQLTGMEKSKIEEEMESIKKKIEEYNLILSSEDRRKEIVAEEISEVERKYSEARRTDIETIDGEVDVEDLIAVEDCVITLTAAGYVKRQKVDTYQTQHRGGRGISGMATKEDDVPVEMFLGCTHDYVMFFSNLGRVYRLKGYEIPEGSRAAKGMNIVNLLPLMPGESINSMIRVAGEYTNDMYLVFVTKGGIIKRTKLSDFNNVRKKGLIALTLRGDDELVSTRLTDGTTELIIATKHGMAIRFAEGNIRVMGRNAAGVRSIKLRTNGEGVTDEVIAMARIREGGKVLTISENGFGRVSEVDNYRLQSRGGYGIKNYKSSIGYVTAIKVVDDDDDIILINDDGVIIRIAVSEIRVCARPSKGVRVMRVPEGGRIVAIARVPHDEEAEKGEIEDDGEEDISDDEELLDEEEALDAEDDEEEVLAEDEE
ncbi:MAG: DNA gyrase subunit A [Oscillospiraceae bacterium]|nr:DNA gyrase subunit A [Oscillospiraceae bacterium]